MVLNPFRPTWLLFLAPKLIIAIKYFISFLFFSVVLMFLYAQKYVNLAWQSCLGLKNVEINDKFLSIREKIALQSGWNGLIKGEL